MANLIIRNRNHMKNSQNRAAFDEFENLVSRIFDSYYPYNSEESIAQMPIELLEKDNNLILKAILPGLKKENINIEASEDKISISAEYNSEHEEKNTHIYRSEFFAGRIERSLQLPQKIDHQKAKADYKDGILTLTLPKSEKEINKVVKLSL